MIAVLTDFGNSEYLGAMKGVICSINKSSKIIDLYNFVNPQNVREAAWILYKNYNHFPKNSVFLCVVDPGVGSKRQCLAIKTKNYFFVGPDNGLIYKAAFKDKIIVAVKLPTEKTSMTFHGRDVFAKAAAMLEKGVKIEQLGKKTTVKAKLDFYLKGREGEIVRIDNFGNIITNLSSLNKSSYKVKTKNLNQRSDFYNTYDSAPSNKLFLIKGSSDTLEISIRNADASKKLKLQVGDKIEIS
ncbi:SAM-dependent chlorinase/fluorinase [Candidatus Woesearchaeota archaeon]|nr:SAM-dependent chlorinase/fluorinase [Candidatus Woesearchaeota archaeon]